MLDLREKTLPRDARLKKEVMASQVVSQARVQLDNSDHFRCHCDSIDIEYEKGRLLLAGRLPSFYLKQVLQTVLRGLPGVRQIENRVDVVSATGLSSVKNRIPEEVGRREP